MSKAERVLKYLQRFGEITSLEIQQLVWCTCPHSIIRDLREKYGYGNITDEWLSNTREIVENGKKRKETIRYKKYYWKGKAA